MKLTHSTRSFNGKITKEIDDIKVIKSMEVAICSNNINEHIIIVKRRE
jgi:hypothetical protein